MPLLNATPLASNVLPIWIYCSLAIFMLIALFNKLVIKEDGLYYYNNVKANAVVNGNHYVGALVGWAQSVNIANCKVSSSAINCINPVGGEDGDKAGAVVGYFSTSKNTGHMPTMNAVASNCVVSAGRDAGQIVGAAKESQVTATATNVIVKNNGTATGANITNDIIGRKL